MSKTKNIRIVVFAAIMSVLLALSAWALSTTVTARAADVDVSSFMLLGFDEPADESDNALRFVINRHWGANAFDVINVTTDKITYTKASTGTKTLSKISFAAKNNVIPVLDFVFEDSDFQEGDTVLIEQGFGFATWNSSETVSVSKDMLFTYTENGWTSGDFIDAEADIQVATAGNATWTVNSGCTVNFGITGMTSGQQIVIDSAAWPANTDAWAHLKTHISYASTQSTNVYQRSWLSADSKLSITNPDDSLTPIEGDLLTLKKGLIVWNFTGAPFYSYGTTATEYKPVLVINEDISFVYSGETWSRVDPVRFINTGDEKAALCVDGTLQLKWEVNAGALDNEPTFTVESGKEDILSVSETGLVTGLKVGTATVTARFSSDITASIELTVYEVAGRKSELVAEVENGSTKNGVKGIVAYKGESLTEEEVIAAVKKAHFVYDNGVTGAKFDLTAENTTVSFDKYSSANAGTTNVTVTVDGISCDVPVHVYELETIERINANRVVTWDVYLMLYLTDVVGGGENINVKTLGYTEANIERYNLNEDMVVLRVPELGDKTKTYPLSTLGHVTEKQCLLHFNGFDGKNVASSIPVGAVLEIKDNFRFYRYIDDSWVAAYKFREPFAFVWTGSEWTDYKADASGFTLAYTEITVPLYSAFIPEVTLNPVGSYMDVTYTSSDSDVVEVKDGKLEAKAPGEAVITLKLGSLQETQSIKVTVEDRQAEGIVLSNERTFYVTQNGEFDISKVRVRVDYGKGSDGSVFYGDEITLSSEMVTYTLDTSVTGKRVVTLNVTVDDHGSSVTDTVDVTVEVPAIQEVYPDNLSCYDDGHIFGANIAVYFSYTFANPANVYPKDLTDEEAESITEHISYVRSGADVTVSGPSYLTSILVFSPQINGEPVTKYLEGDKILLTKGLSFFRWYGDVNDSNVPVGEGEYVKIGELKYDVEIIYGANGKFAWHIAPADGILLEEKVVVGLGEQHAANTATVPSYATSGEWSYTVSDTDIATVSTQGLISGKKIGTTHVVAVLKNLAGEVVATREFDIEVADAISGLKITSEKPIVLAPGTDLDVSELIAQFGLKGATVMASGADGKEVDLSSARVTGYSADKLGTQTLTFRLTVDGKSVVGTIDITVGEDSGDNGCGCGGSLASVSSLIAGGGILAIAMILALRKRREINR